MSGTTSGAASTSTSRPFDPTVQHDDPSTIIVASTVVGFIFLGLTGILLFLKISRSVRVRRERKRFLEWDAKEHQGRHPKNRHIGRWHTSKGKNAFDILEEDEGIPA